MFDYNHWIPLPNLLFSRLNTLRPSASPHVPCGAGTSLFSDPSLSSPQVIRITLVTKGSGWDTVPGAASGVRAGLPALAAPCAQTLPLQCLCLLLAQCTKGCPQMICVLISMCFPLQSRKSGQLYNAEVCGEVCSLI